MYIKNEGIKTYDVNEYSSGKVMATCLLYVVTDAVNID